MTKDMKNSESGIHIGLIPDGNRRYSKEKGLPTFMGHERGAKRIEEFLEWCDDYYPKIKMISIFALSTENLNRSELEMKALWGIYKHVFEKLLHDERVINKKLRVRIYGNDMLWKPEIKEVAKDLYNSTKTYSRMALNFLLAYGSKFEINNAMKKIIKKPFTKLDKSLYVNQPLDLVIRTGKAHRLSNFMLYQASYAEIYFSDTLWPEFSRKEFDKIMSWYFNQQRKFGS
jgi:undecaprenyl diphosphate synthase